MKNIPFHPIAGFFCVNNMSKIVNCKRCYFYRFIKFGFQRRDENKGIDACGEGKRIKKIDRTITECCFFRDQYANRTTPTRY
jgi:hypothetical protein